MRPIHKLPTARTVSLAFILGAVSVGVYSCSSETAASPKAIQEKYGVPAALDSVSIPDGSVEATIVPVTLADGRRAQLVIPRTRTDHSLYLRDESGVKPVLVEKTAERDEFVRSRPVMVERTTAPVQKKKRSLKKEILIVAGSAGAGTAIGAVAGGRKGAAIGAISGGLAGLVYDMATRNE
jgi:hypothetical protein